MWFNLFCFYIYFEFYFQITKKNVIIMIKQLRFKKQTEEKKVQVLE